MTMEKKEGYSLYNFTVSNRFHQSEEFVFFKFQCLSFTFVAFYVRFNRARRGIIQFVFPFMPKLWTKSFPAEFQCNYCFYCRLWYNLITYLMIFLHLIKIILLDWYWGSKQRELPVSWRDAIARTLFHDVIDILLVGSFLVVFAQKEHVSIFSWLISNSFVRIMSFYVFFCFSVILYSVSITLWVS